MSSQETNKLPIPVKNLRGNQELLQEAAKKIKAIILDVDGVLTDGRFGYTSNPDDEVKFFNAQDGHAMKMAMRGDLLIGVISGRKSAANRKRFEELEISFFHERQKVKLDCFAKVLTEHNLKAEECLYMGDDVIDIPLLRRVGIGVAVSNSVPDTLKHADMITELPGGHGAVREVINLLLQTQNKWDNLMTRYLA